MEPLSWITVAELAIQYGLPLAEDLIKKWENKTPVSLAAFQELKALSAQTAADRMKAQLVAAGIPLDSPQALALIAQAS